MRQEWTARYGVDPTAWATRGAEKTDDVCNGVGAAQNFFLPGLIFFAHSARMEDAALVSAACGVLFGGSDPVILQQRQQERRGESTDRAGAGAEARAVAGDDLETYIIRFRTRRVARFALRALTQHPELAAGTVVRGVGGEVIVGVVPLVTAVLRATDPAAWGPGLGLSLIHI